MKKLINNFKNWNPSKLVIILILLFPLYYFFSNKFKVDNDFWFLINTGKNILEEGFASIEPFTIHAGLAYMPQQWLTCVIFYLIFKCLGISGMFCFVIICYVLLTLLLYKIAYLLSENKKISLLITLFINIFIITMSILTTRPQIIDLIFFTLELYILELFIKKGNKKILYIIPLISLLMINLHASMWMMLFVFLVPYYIEYIVLKLKKKTFIEIKPLIIITVLSLLAGLINPYGINAITYLFRSYGIKEINSLIGEMHAIEISNLTGKIAFVLIGFTFFSFYLNKGKNRIRYFLLALGTSYLFLSHLKGILYFLVVFAPVVGYNFKNNRQLKTREMFKIEKIIYSLIIATFLGLVLSISKLDKKEELSNFADYLDKNSTHEIKLYTGYDDGSYMEYRGYKCYIDPRAEVFLKSNNKKKDIFSEYYKLINGDIDASLFLKDYQFDYLLVSEKDKFLHKELKANKEYEEVYSERIYDKDENNKKITYMKYLYKRRG